MSSAIFDLLKGEMIVSCQAEGGDPFNTPEYVSLFAKAAQMGGAKGIRSEGINNIIAIKEMVNLPIIGLLKDTFENGFVKITGSFKDVEKLMKVKCDIIAIDGTFRKREGLTGPDFIKSVKDKYDCIVMADISTLEEAIASEKSGADCISTALSGYTPEKHFILNKPDFKLIKLLSHTISVPIFAEGRINTPKEARRSIELGAHAVITGTAITRPRVITSWFVNELKNIKI